MTTIQQKGEPIRLAVKWISSARQNGDGRELNLLIEEAATRFNLSPKDEKFLESFYEDGGE